MTPDATLTEIQRRIAERKDYTDLRIEEYKGTLHLLGAKHQDEGPTIVPRWPWDWSDAGELVTEMVERAWANDGWCEWNTSARGDHNGDHAFVFRLRDGVARPVYYSGHTFQEAASRAWCGMMGVDLSDLSSAAVSATS